MVLNGKEARTHDVPLCLDQAYSWRDDAMNTALRGLGYGEHIDALLEAIRTHRPDCATLTLWPDGRQLLSFLREDCRGFRSLLAGSHKYRYNDAEGYWPYAGWYAVEWDGETVEVIVSPDVSYYFDTICVGASDQVLVRFAEAYYAYTRRRRLRCMRYTQGWEHAPDIEREIGKVTWDDLVLPEKGFAQ